MVLAGIVRRDLHLDGLSHHEQLASLKLVVAWFVDCNRITLARLVLLFLGFAARSITK